MELAVQQRAALVCQSAVEDMSQSSVLFWLWLKKSVLISWIKQRWVFRFHLRRKDLSSHCAVEGGTPPVAVCVCLSLYLHFKCWVGTSTRKCFLWTTPAHTVSHNVFHTGVPEPVPLKICFTKYYKIPCCLSTLCALTPTPPPHHFKPVFVSAATAAEWRSWKSQV